MGDRSRRAFYILRAALSTCVFAAAFATASPPREDNPLSTTFVNRTRHPAIDYAKRTPADPVAKLQKKIDAGEVTLKSDGPAGYLRSLLEALSIPISSQVAVFVPDSAQRDIIKLQNPRTIFFGDDVAIGWVRGGFVEIAAQDPTQSVVFYSLDRTFTGKPSLRRRDDCLTCHHNYSTAGVPGMVVRSAGQYNVDHSTPIEDRWGGWYVTGNTGSIRHLGNMDIDSAFQTSRTADNLNWKSFDRKFDTTGYLTSQSDVVALMIFEHQMHMMNLLSRIGWEARLAQYQARVPSVDDVPIPLDVASREVVDYMLFIDEASIRGKVLGSTSFSQEFPATGLRDRKGRSLRDLKLEGRLMRYPCSYLIYSAQFDSLPAQAKDAIYRRLWFILSGQEKGPRYSRLTSADRIAITEILRDTKKDLPEYFQPTASTQGRD
jgi:hypothetical protein